MLRQRPDRDEFSKINNSDGNPKEHRERAKRAVISKSQAGVTLRSDSDRPADIFAAAEAGDLESVKRFITDQLVSVNVRAVGTGETPLFKAVQSGHLTVIEYLVDAGATINHTDKWGYHCLLWAVDQKTTDLNIIKYLVDSGADVNLKEKKKGYTALHSAAFHNNPDVVKCLIEHGADLRIESNSGETPADLAAQNGSFEVIDLLLQKGDPFDIFTAAAKGYTDAVKFFVEWKRNSPNAADRAGWTPLHRAAYNGHLETVKYLVDEQGARVGAKNTNNASPLTPVHAAAENGHTDVVQYLVEKGADFNTRDSKGKSPMYWAASNGHLDVIKFLVDDKKAFYYQRDNDENTLLHAASWNGHLSVVKYLVEEKRMDVNVKDSDGNTPLLEAIYQNQVQVFQYLLHVREIDVNLANNEGWTPLYFAAKTGYLQVLKNLVDKGADIHAKNGVGRTALYSAAGGWSEKGGRLNIVRYFIDEHKCDPFQRDNEGNTLLHAADWNGSLDVVKYLIEEKKLNVNAKDNDGNCPLSEAIYRKKTNVFQYLLGVKGIDVQQANNEGKTPMIFAIDVGSLPMVKELVNKGVSINVRDASGRTAVYGAAGGPADLGGRLDILRYFIDELKADPFQKDKYGNTLLHAADWNGSLDVVKYLIEEKKLNVNAKDNDGNCPLSEAIYRKKTNVFQYLLGVKGIDVQQANNEGKTPMIFAIDVGSLPMVKELVNKGVSINVRDASGRTAVYGAAGGPADLGGRLDILRYFIDEHKADPFQKDNYGNTLLHAAEWTGSLDVVKYLVEEKKLDVNAKDNDGNTPLSEAIERGKSTVVQYLQSKGARPRRRRNAGRIRRKIDDPREIGDLSASLRHDDLVAATNSRAVDEPPPATNSASRSNCWLGGAVDMISSVSHLILPSAGPVSPTEVTSSMVGGFMLLIDVVARQFTRVSYKQPVHESLLSAEELIARRFDYNAIVAIEQAKLEYEGDVYSVRDTSIE